LLAESGIGPARKWTIESPLDHPIEGTIFAKKRSAQSRLIDDLDDATRPRINQHGLVIHNRISVVGRTVLVWNIIVGNARIRQNYADLNRLSIMKRRMVLLDHIVLEARTLIDAEYTGYTARDRPNGPSHYGANGPRRSITLARALFHTSNDTLGHG
jgi:hypothetical protein